MKIVIDTNVLLSAFLFGGNSGKVVEYCVEAHSLFSSPWILKEFSNHLRVKFKVSVKQQKRIIDLIRSEFTIVKPHTKMPDLCRDTDDNHVLQLAESSEADFIITGDKDLLVMHHYKNTIILNPRDFLSLLKQ